MTAKNPIEPGVYMVTRDPVTGATVYTLMPPMDKAAYSTIPVGADNTTTTADDQKATSRAYIAGKLDKLAAIRQAIEAHEDDFNARHAELMDEVWEKVAEVLPDHRGLIDKLNADADAEEAVLAGDAAAVEEEIREAVAALGEPVRGVWLRAAQNKDSIKWNPDMLSAFLEVYPAIKKAMTTEPGKVQITAVKPPAKPTK